MSLHLFPLHAQRAPRLPLPPEHHPAGGALLVVLVIISACLSIGALEVVDVAVSGALRQLRSAPAEVSLDPMEAGRGAIGEGDENMTDALLVEVPPAAVDAINL